MSTLIDVNRYCHVQAMSPQEGEAAGKARAMDEEALARNHLVAAIAELRDCLRDEHSNVVQASSFPRHQMTASSKV